MAQRKPGMAQERNFNSEVANDRYSLSLVPSALRTIFFSAIFRRAASAPKVARCFCVRMSRTARVENNTADQLLRQRHQRPCDDYRTRQIGWRSGWTPAPAIITKGINIAAGANNLPA